MLRQLLSHRFLRAAVLGRRAFFPPTFLTVNLGRHCPEDVGLRPFSTRPHRPRGGGSSHGYEGGRGSSDSFGSRTLRRGEFQTGSLSGRGGGGPKSLIEDEAELSDWVGGINTSSLSLGLRSESDEDSGRESGMGRGRGRRGGRDGVSSSRRSRDDDFDDYGRRSSRGLPSKRSSKLYSDNDDDDEDEDEDELFSSTKRPTGLRSRDELSSRGGRYSGSKLSRVRDDGDSMRRSKAPAKRARRIMESEDDEDDIGDLSGAGESEEEESDSDIELFKERAHKVESETITRKEMAPKSTSNGKSGSYLSETRFDQCSISPLSLKGIKEAGYEKMTVVQEATLPLILKGKDVLAKAKTGTGKTVAFLLPAIEVVAKVTPPDRDNKRPPINVLIVCPTRELATQASNEANKLLKFHPSIGVQVVIGGTRLALEQKRMQANPCQILVATPGRLRDHIENTPGFASRLMGVKVLVLDEADHLLDMGFRKDIEKIVAAVPKQRQSLLFSATVPEEVQQIGLIALKRDYEFINTVQEGSEETHAQVKQMHLVAPLDKHFALLYSILKEHIGEEADYKVLVFCTTAMVTRLVSELLAELNLNVREIHSRKPQSYRTRVSDEFRRSKGLILVTSDVSARGVDYPDVTFVVQVGLPSEREQYIHRLGRTGRKGKEGKGILLLAPWEEFFLSSINDLPITKAPPPSIDPDMRKKVDRALSHVQMKNKEAAYQAWLGYYNSSKNIGRDKVRLVQLANEFSRSMGMDNPPAIPKVVIGKMGLKNVPGLRIK